jgi:hypothetical protein
MRRDARVAIDRNADLRDGHGSPGVDRFIHARQRGQSWAGRRAPISEGALLERGQAQFWKTPSTIHDRRRRHECGNLTMPVGAPNGYANRVRRWSRGKD